MGVYCVHAAACHAWGRATAGAPWGTTSDLRAACPLRANRLECEDGADSRPVREARTPGMGAHECFDCRKCNRRRRGARRAGRRACDSRSALTSVQACTSDTVRRGNMPARRRVLLLSQRPDGCSLGGNLCRRRAPLQQPLQVQRNLPDLCPVPARRELLHSHVLWLRRLGGVQLRLRHMGGAARVDVTFVRSHHGGRVSSGLALRSHSFSVGLGVAGLLCSVAAPGVSVPTPVSQRASRLGPAQPRPFSRSSSAASRCISISLSFGRDRCRLTSISFSRVSTRTEWSPTSRSSLCGRRSS